ncbi:hypothetical protein SAMN02745857_02811 [Andreprevotia lacus DSM 23236]|jgi:hypothetical protein|uniref:Uncharacterized protein n=1 Tax=Andreprevotia lacus DSM 23236 TaxID=1121001 RepID=A0A1W1XTX4_9NEIS|nr:hypothetical protein [Andreprevotia lacus]SMC27314.1 hypothetical protein SAMN02745857_02811 [Andreprevotia lacus DSM 23236]
MTIPTWQTAQHLLADFDGAATEIFLIGLPISQLPAVIAVLSALPALEVLAHAGETLATGSPFDRQWQARLESIPSHACQHALRSACGSAQHLQIYLWLDPGEGWLELELVFWNDMTFPAGLCIDEYEQRLQALCAIVEQCRSGVPGTSCILTAEHNGPTSELEKHVHAVRW